MHLEQIIKKKQRDCKITKDNPSFGQNTTVWKKLVRTCKQIVVW